MRPIFILYIFFLLLTNNATAQDNQGFKDIDDTSWKNQYRGFVTKENDLVHTKLAANFDYSKSQLNGEAWLQLRPHFYATNTLSLDAKGMDLHQVGLWNNNKVSTLRDFFFSEVKLPYSKYVYFFWRIPERRIDRYSFPFTECAASN